MYITLSEIQKEKYCQISGHKYNEGELKGSFTTKIPFNDPGWTHSPWTFSFVLQSDTGYFICELSHPLTSNRVYGFDRQGFDLPAEVIHSVFPLREFNAPPAERPQTGAELA